LAKKYEAHIIIDEAHSTGVMGKNGSGMICELNLEDAFLARVYTFGKGMGVHGACVCGSLETIEYLINFGRPFIYTTALPIHSIFSIDASFEYLANHIDLQKKLHKNIEYFNQLYDEHFVVKNGMLKPFSDTCIQPVIFPGNEKIKKLAQRFQVAGLDVRPILSPTVKSGTERLRISIHAHNTAEEIERLIGELINSI
jgi:8-amino-7-oxononanoate synthase